MTFVGLSRTKPEKMNARFTFPGLSFVCRADTPVEEMDVGNYSVGPILLSVELSRKTHDRDKTFWLRAVFNVETGERLWRPTSDSRSLLCEVSGQAVIVILSFTKKDGSTEVVDTVLFSDLATKKPSSVPDQLSFKKQAAKLLGVPFVLTADEALEEERQQEEKRQEVLREAEAHAAALNRACEERLAYAREVGADKRLAKVNRVATILARPKIKVVAMGNLPLRGVPVLEGEWEALSDGTPVVLVKGFDQKTGLAIDPQEYFLVSKTVGGRAKKQRAQTVVFCPGRSGNWANAQKLASATPVTNKVVVQDGDVTRTVIVFETMDDIRKAHQGGLNNHTLVARREGDSAKSGKLEIFQVTSEGIANYKHLSVVSVP